MDDLEKLRKSLPSDDEVPTLAQWIASLESRLQEDIGWEQQFIKSREKREEPIEPIDRLRMAAATNKPGEARAIMKQQDWNGASKPYPDEESWYKDASLMFYSCYGNNGFTRLLDYKMLLFLADHDPANVLSSSPSGGSMLHATLQGPPNPHLVKELLLRGVNPYRKDAGNEKHKPKTYLEGIKAQADMFQYDEFQPIIDMVTQFIAEHSEIECAQREARLIEEAKAQDVRRRIHGTSHGFLNR